MNNILIFLITLIILIILWTCLIDNRDKNYKIVLEEAGFTNFLQDYSIKNEDNQYPKNIDTSILNECQVPTLNMEQCYKSKFFECPIVNGSYLQCTNNYIPKPNEYNAECDNRTFEMVPYPWKISENCYYNKINFDRDKVYGKVKYV